MAPEPIRFPASRTSPARSFNDTLTGNTLNNTLRGGAGNDTLSGGLGADTFDFSSLTNGSDVITDFVSGTDTIALLQVFNSIGLDGLSYLDLIGAGKLVIETGYYATDTASNNAASLDTRLYIDTDGFGPGSGILIATLEDTLTTSGDFLV